MKTKLLTLLCGIMALSGSVSCTSYGPHTKRAAVVGGAIGAGTGAIIGNQSGRALEGAGVGALVGALAGGLLGSARDDDYSRGPRGGGGGYYDRGYSNRGSYHSGYSHHDHSCRY